jgi:hypothetical protein
MKKLICFVLSLLCLLSLCAPCAMAANEADFQLTIDVNERYTDISDTVEGQDVFGYRNQEEKEKETKRNTYVAILSVALVISVIILVVCLKRVPKEKDITIGDKNKKEEKDQQ